MLVAGGIGQGYLNRPKVPEHLGFYLDAFWDLNSGEGIPFSELDCYARRYGFDGTDDFDRFKALVKRLDGEYAKYRSEKIKEATKGGGAKVGPRPL
jgi:hypothetical protein